MEALFEPGIDACPVRSISPFPLRTLLCGYVTKNPGGKHDKDGIDSEGLLH